MNRYADPSMNRLADSLGATNVLSGGYRRTIEGYALAAIGEGFHRGVVKGRERSLLEDRPVTSSRIIAAQEAEASYLRRVDNNSFKHVNDDERVRLMLEAAEAVR